MSWINNKAHLDVYPREGNGDKEILLGASDEGARELMGLISFTLITPIKIFQYSLSFMVDKSRWELYINLGM